MLCWGNRVDEIAKPGLRFLSHLHQCTIWAHRYASAVQLVTKYRRNRAILTKTNRVGGPTQNASLPKTSNARPTPCLYKSRIQGVSVPPKPFYSRMHFWGCTRKKLQAAYLTKRQNHIRSSSYFHGELFSSTLSSQSIKLELHGKPFSTQLSSF